jgi:GNAT superfamily N-acetyltransferase
VPPFSIFAAQTEDCAECASLLVEQLREHGVEASAGPLTRLLERIVTDKDRGFVQLARAEGRVVGVAHVATILSVEHVGPVAWLEELYVTPVWRQQGVGTALVTAILARARAGGIVAVDLEVDASHGRAAALYQRLGFRRLDRSRWVKNLGE